LKGKKIAIMESLTQKRKMLMKRISMLRKAKKIKSCWSVFNCSYDGKLFYTLPVKPSNKIELSLTNADEQLLTIIEIEPRPAPQKVSF